MDLIPDSNQALLWKRRFILTLTLISYTWITCRLPSRSCCSVTKSCLTVCEPWTATCQASLSIVIIFFFFFFFIFYIELHELFPRFGDSFLSIFNSRRLLKLMPIESVMPSIKPTHPLSSPSPRPSIFPSIRVFCNKSVLCIRWPKYWPLQHQSFQGIFRTDFL